MGSRVEIERVVRELGDATQLHGDGWSGATEGIPEHVVMS